MRTKQFATATAVGLISLGVATEALAADPTDDPSSTLKDRLSFSGAIEVDTTWAKDYGKKTTSDITLSTASFGIEAKMVEWAIANLTLEWDDEEDNVTVDEAFFTLGKTEDLPAYISAGRLYLPFGDFSTHMIQDPFTLTLGEVRATSLVAGYEIKGFSSAVFFYKGMADADGDDDEKINGYGASARYQYEAEELAFSAGFAWINNLGDASSIDDYFDEMGLAGIDDRINGLAAHATASFGPYSLFVEYVRALDSFATEELSFAGKGAEPSALNVEAAYSFEFFGRETVLALGYQHSAEAISLEIPEQRLLASVSYQLFEGFNVIGEYRHDQDYDTDDGGSDQSADGVALRLSYEF